MRIQWNILCLATTIMSTTALASEVLIISGEYSGKNLYVQNPLLPDNRFSTEQVFVNDQLVLSNPMTSAFTVNLSHLAINQPVEVRIIHRERYQPRIINPHVLHGNTINSTASSGPVVNVFRWINVDGTTLRWLTHGERGGGVFEVQRKLQGQWVSLDTIPAKPQSDESVYRVLVAHEKGQNGYRIKLTDRDGYVTYSDPIEYKLR